MSVGSKFHRRYMLSANALTTAAPVTAQITPRFVLSPANAIAVPDFVRPVAPPAEESFWDKEIFGIENRIAVPVGVGLALTALYFGTRKRRRK